MSETGETLAVPNTLCQCVTTALAIHDIERRWKECMGSYPAEVSIFELLWKVHGMMVQVVAETVGDEFGWLDWFIWENDCGRSGIEVRDAMGMRRPMRTVEELWELILIDLEKKEGGEA